MSTTLSNFNPVTTQTWTNGRHGVRCVKVIQETWDVRTFCFMAEQPVMFFFKPGQFVTLELEIDAQQIMRSYTISSSPSVPYSFSITVKRVPGGLVSNWLHDNLNEGDVLAVHGPVGNFNCIDYPAERILMLSGGVGITPLMSMARWYFDTNANVDISFVHSARSRATSSSGVSSSSWIPACRSSTCTSSASASRRARPGPAIAAISPTRCSR